jgi:cytochrome c oxidase subunit II
MSTNPRHLPSLPSQVAAGVRLGALLAAAILLPAGARADAPMSYLRASGPKGQHIVTLTWALLIQSIVVIAIISVLVLVGVLVRRSRRSTRPGEALPVEESGSGLSWIYIGVGLSILALVASTVWTGFTMAAIRQPPSPPAFTVQVIGHRWWWEVRYLSNDSSPIGQPVLFEVLTADVIHSFWIPGIGDKIDLIPNQTNVTWLEAGQRGIYRGNCAEFCGAQHAHMGILVVADDPAAFQAWWDGQIKPASAPPGSQLAEGQTQFVLRCGACHTVRGTQAGGRVGPDLTHLMSRHAIASITLPNTIAYLSGWIADPQKIKPGNLMPTLDLSGPELASIRSYLETLK